MTMNVLFDLPAEEIGTTIKTERERLGVSIIQLSAIADIKVSTITAIERHGGGYWNSVHACIWALRYCYELSQNGKLEDFMPKKPKKIRLDLP
jgi:hypothetical protein